MEGGEWWEEFIVGNWRRCGLKSRWREEGYGGDDLLMMIGVCGSCGLRLYNGEYMEVWGRGLGDDVVKFFVCDEFWILK